MLLLLSKAAGILASWIAVVCTAVAGCRGVAAWAACMPCALSTNTSPRVCCACDGQWFDDSLTLLRCVACVAALCCQVRSTVYYGLV
jgi:hypothetical protein